MDKVHDMMAVVTKAPNRQSDDEDIDDIEFV